MNALLETAIVLGVGGVLFFWLDRQARKDAVRGSILEEQQ